MFLRAVPFLMLSLVLGVGAGFILAADPARTVAGDDPLRAESVDFNRDVRPLLSDRCFKCHGPDAGLDGSDRKAGLRLDTREGAFAGGRSGPALVAGNALASELYRRISSPDPDRRMPPADSGKSLSEREITTLRRWIDDGADWSRHWSFEPPRRPAPPSVADPTWVRNPIDRFVLARLESAGLQPAPEADRRTLIRRVTFDLSGLPPTPEETEAFVADAADGAYERVVERLLASPRYGEHRARYWLDAVRYGDTHGLHLDNERSMWPYRDWVIRAFNSNRPFDEFTVEQLAGDLLPEPTLDQRIATGYLRCNVTTNEGGTIVEEAYVRNVVDRVETTSTVFLGLTAGCAVCHDHKYDPLSQREFYQLFAFFNSGTDNPMDGNALAPPPTVRVPAEGQVAELERLGAEIVDRETRFAAPDAQLDAAEQEWARRWHERLRDGWQMLVPTEVESRGGATLTVLEDRSVLASGENPGTDRYRAVARTDMTGIIAVKLEALNDPSLPKGGTSRASHGNFVLNEFTVEAVSLADPSRSEKIELIAAHADYSQPRYDINLAIDGDARSGWAMDGRVESHWALFYPREPFGFEGGTELRVTMTQEFGGQHNIGRFRLSVSSDPGTTPAACGIWQLAGPFREANARIAYDTAYPPEQEVQPGARYRDGSIAWTPRADFVDGRSHDLKGANSATYLHRVIHAPSPRRLTLSLGSDDDIKVWHDGELVLEHYVPRPVAPDQETVELDLHAGRNELLLKIVNRGGGYAFYFRRKDEDLGGVPVELASLLALPPGARSADQRSMLRDFYRVEMSKPYRRLREEITARTAQRTEIETSLPVTLVFAELPEPKPAFLLNRGQYDQKGDRVERRVPAALPSFPEGAPPDRLGFARWLVSGEHPLTARVTVNRYWQQILGTGIVKTAEDFGGQGEWPSHPALLDWLATEFVASGWDVKGLQRLIVTSASYMQSSRVSHRKLKLDPENRLISRGPRFRLDAEVIRDNALAVSGLLVERIGGKGVKPYQPAGLWKAVGYTRSNTANFKQDQGEALFRRSIYTFWKRTSPPPAMAILDAPTREACTVRRSRTNTPTAALALMNDVQFVEASRHLAARLLREGGANDAERIEYGFLLLLARPCAVEERSEVEGLLARFRGEFAADPDAARALIQFGDTEPGVTVEADDEAAELAAWTMVANLLLNLVETVTKG